QEMVRAVREVRNRYGIDNRTPLDVFVRCGEAIAQDFRALSSFIAMLAGVGKLECGPSVAKPAQAGGHVSGGFELYSLLSGLIDVVAEAKRLQKQIAEKQKFAQAALAKLSNESFVSKAPKEVVEQQKEQVSELQKQIASLQANLAELQNQKS